MSKEKKVNHEGLHWFAQGFVAGELCASGSRDLGVRFYEECLAQLGLYPPPSRPDKE